MNIIWICIISFSLILLIFTQPNLVMISFLDGSSKAIELIIKLWAIYAFWMGILKIIEDTKLNLKINKLLKKPINFIFGNISNEAKNQISTNISCNMLGMGNASIPSGIKAMEILSVVAPILLVVLIVVAIFAMGYVKASPDKAYIISGLRKQPKVLIGKAGIKIPFLEKKDELSLQLIPIDVKTNAISSPSTSKK